MNLLQIIETTPSLELLRIPVRRISSNLFMPLHLFSINREKFPKKPTCNCLYCQVVYKTNEAKLQYEAANRMFGLKAMSKKQKRHKFVFAARRAKLEYLRYSTLAKKLEITLEIPDYAKWQY